MAYLRLGCIGEASGHNKALGLKRCIEYIFNPEKTNGNEYIGGYNMFLQRADCVSQAYTQMVDTKRFLGKEWGRQAYHYKLSFADGDEVTPELALKITNEFCKRCLTEYECAYSVHDNTEHLHSHIVFNSVNINTGYKYRYEKGDWSKYIQPVVNDICKRYGLSELNLLRDEKKKKTQKYKYEKKLPEGKYTRDKIALDVEECIAKASTYEEFVALMRGKGHLYKDTGKYITVLAPGMERATRLYKLTPDGRYTKENIIKMIGGVYMTREEVREKLFADFDAYTNRVKDTLAYKYDLKYAKLLEEYTLIRVKGLCDKKALDMYKSYLLAADKELNIMRKKIYKQLDRYAEDYKKLDELLDLFQYFRAYKASGDERYLSRYNRCLTLYGELCSKGYDICELNRYRIQATNFIKKLNEFKKNVYVQRKIATRIENKNLVQPNKNATR